MNEIILQVHQLGSREKWEGIFHYYENHIEQRRETTSGKSPLLRICDMFNTDQVLGQ